MIGILKLIIFVALLLLAHVSCGARQGVNVTLYYETLCPDSQRFVSRQLYPVWKDLKDFISLKFVPFGKASGDSIMGFKCQHGVEECRGNMMQSCVLDMLTTAGPQMEFVYCVMNSIDGTSAGERCSQKVGVNWIAVQGCMKSKAGINLQLMAQEQTLSVFNRGLGFVPTVTFNNVYNERDQREALRNFRAVVCRYIGSPAPDGC
ncbi:GILT-like protein 1 [Periplaneta americana]|uniref:GILT-like protein 1 n=1 Tax=Periplaneta americana TaxID=6978 RepID=UPI0037E797FB